MVIFKECIASQLHFLLNFFKFFFQSPLAWNVLDQSSFYNFIASCNRKELSWHQSSTLVINFNINLSHNLWHNDIFLFKGNPILLNSFVQNLNILICNINFVGQQQHLFSFFSSFLHLLSVFKHAYPCSCVFYPAVKWHLTK